MTAPAKVALLVSSCDKFSDLWGVFFESLDRYWPDCVFQKFLLSNFKVFSPSSDVTTLAVGEDSAWSANLLKALHRLEDFDYVFMMMEDGFLCEAVDDAAVNSLVEQFIQDGGRFLNMMREPVPQEDYNGAYGIIPSGSPYRMNVTFAIWERLSLIGLLEESESAWEFEKKGARRADTLDGFYSTHQNMFKHIHGVIKGKWVPSALTRLRTLGFHVEPERETIPRLEVALMDAYSIFRKTILFLTPEKYRKYWIRN